MNRQTVHSTHSEIQIPAKDGTMLAATLYPACDNTKVAIINSATAVPRQFYRYFAGVLQEAGYTTITFDYRGIGESRPKSLKGFSANIKDWIFSDMDGVIAWVKTQLKPDKIVVCGHSVGGQVLGMLENAKDIDAVVTVAANSGYWRLLGGNQRYMTGFHAYITMPLLPRILGYMPWSWFGPMDLPKGVTLEWARWCRKPNYFLDDQTMPTDRFNNFEAPVLSYSFEDDLWGTKRAVDALSKVYPKLERRHIDPITIGLKKVGHIGFFRPASEPLWRDAIGWVDAAV